MIYSHLLVRLSTKSRHPSISSLELVCSDCIDGYRLEYTTCGVISLFAKVTKFSSQMKWSFLHYITIFILSMIEEMKPANLILRVSLLWLHRWISAIEYTTCGIICYLLKSPNLAAKWNDPSSHFINILILSMKSWHPSISSLDLVCSDCIDGYRLEYTTCGVISLFAKVTKFSSQMKWSKFSLG